MVFQNLFEGEAVGFETVMEPIAENKMQEMRRVFVRVGGSILCDNVMPSCPIGEGETIGILARSDLTPSVPHDVYERITYGYGIDAVSCINCMAAQLCKARQDYMKYNKTIQE